MTPEIEQAFARLRYGADLDLEDLQWLELIHKKYTAIYEAERKLQETVVALEKAEAKAQALKEKVKKTARGDRAYGLYHQKLPRCGGVASERGYGPLGGTDRAARSCPLAMRRREPARKEQGGTKRRKVENHALEKMRRRK